MAGLGLALALVGRDPRTAEARFTLRHRLPARRPRDRAVLLGLFAVAEIDRS